MKKISVLFVMAILSLSTVLNAAEIKITTEHAQVEPNKTVDATRGYYEDSYLINDQHGCDERWAKNTYTTYDKNNNLPHQYVKYYSDSSHHPDVSKTVSKGTAKVNQNVQKSGSITFNQY